MVMAKAEVNNGAVAEAVIGKHNTAFVPLRRTAPPKSYRSCSKNIPAAESGRMGTFSAMPDLIVLLLLALAGTALLWGGLRLAFPKRASKHHDARSLEALHGQFRWTGLQHVAWVLLWTVLGSLLAMGLFELAENLLWAKAQAKSLHWIGPDRTARFLLGLVGGAALGLRMGLWHMRRSLGSAFSAYIDYQNRVTGLANERATRAFAAFLVLGCLLLNLAFLDWYSAFGPEGIRQRPLFSFETRVQPYGNIETLQTLGAFVRPDGRICTLEHYRIRFADGSRWDSRNSGFENPERNRDLFAFLADKTGLPVIDVVPDGMDPAPAALD